MCPPNFSAAIASFFSAHAAGDVGTFVSEVLMPRLTGVGDHVLHPLPPPRYRRTSSFNGVTAVAVLPRYFEEFYALIGRSSGQSLRHWSAPMACFSRAIRSSATVRAASIRRARCAARSREGLERAIYTVSQSQIDAIDRRVGYRKLEGFPVYVVAGIDGSAILAEWLATMSSHLIFGLPATFLLFVIIGVALHRTRAAA